MEEATGVVFCAGIEEVTGTEVATGTVVTGAGTATVGAEAITGNWTGMVCPSGSLIITCTIGVTQTDCNKYIILIKYI